MSTNYWIGAVIVLLLLTGGWYVFSEPKIAEGEPVRIGVVIPLTGIAAIVGENERAGIALAVKEINDSSGVNGRPLEVVIEDDHTEPKQTVTAIQKLISIDNVDALIGGTWDFLANAAISVIEQNQVVMVTPSALPDTLERTSDFLFVTHSPVAINESAVERFLAGISGNKVAIVSVNNLWGQAHLATFKKAIANSGKSLVKEIIVPQFDNNDLQTEIALIKQSNPDIIITALNFGDSVVFLRKKSELGIGGKILGDFHFIDGYNQGNIPSKFLSGTTVFVFSDPSPDFVAAYTKEYGEPPGTYADTAYDAVYVLKEAIENARGETDSASIIAGLRRVTDYRGASGLIDFSQNNYPANKLPMLKIFTDNQFVNLQ